MQFSQFGDQQDRLQLDPDHGESVNAFLYGDVAPSPNVVDDYWEFTIIGSNNKKLGVTP